MPAIKGLTAVALLISLISMSNASGGDRSWNFQKCLQRCKHRNCSISDEDFAKKQQVHLQLLQWDCVDECKYTCMWETVDAYERDGSGVPQFYGKWPFIRVIGVQEPASVVFSLLNGIAHVYMIVQYRKRVPKEAPLYFVWHCNAMVAINAWFWSVVFHSRDFPITEQMDYFCAISVVLYQLYALFARILGTRNVWKPGIALLIILGFFTYHVHYLAFIHFDYGYNMKATASVVLMNAVGWLAWCWYNRAQMPQVSKCAMSVVGVGVFACMELGDFPPFWWTFDAHSLWHGGTAPITLLWYSFVIEDSLYLLKEERGELRYQIEQDEKSKDA